MWSGAEDRKKRHPSFWRPGVHGLLSGVNRQWTGRVRRIGWHHLGADQALGEFAPTLDLEHCRLVPLHHWIKHRHRGYMYPQTVLLLNLDDERGSSAHHSWYLPVCATPHISWSSHSYHGRAGICPKPVWLLDHVTPHPDYPFPNQDGGGNAQRALWR